MSTSKEGLIASELQKDSALTFDPHKNKTKSAKDEKSYMKDKKVSEADGS